MGRDVNNKGLISIVVLVVLAALAIVLILSLSWATEGKGEGRMLADFQRVISALDIGIESAKKKFPDPVTFNFKAEDISIFSGGCSQEPTNELTTDVPSLIQFSCEKEKAVILKTAATANARVFNRGTVKRVKLSYNSVIIPK